MIGAFVGIIFLGLSEPVNEVAVANRDSEIESMTEFELKYAYYIGIVMALLSAVFESTTAVASRRLKVLHFAVIQFSYGIISAIATGIFLICSCAMKGTVPYIYPSPG